MKTIDLHTHTSASDGTFSPVEIVDYAVEKGLSALALTDHDTMGGVQEAMDHIHGNRLPLELIPGIEISARSSGFYYGLHILGYFIDKSGSDLSNLLMNFEREMQSGSFSAGQAIDIITEYGGLPVLAHPKDYFLSMSEFDKLVAELAAVGLKGVECIYTTHSVPETEAFREITLRHNLIVTGGTDFHGGNKPGVDLGRGYGTLEIPYEAVDAIRKVSAAC